MPPTNPQHGEDRQAFLDRVRQALGRGATAAPGEPAPAADPALVRLASADDDLIALFAEKAAGIGMVVHRATSAEAAAAITGVLSTLGVKRLVVSAGQAGQAIGLDAALDAAAVQRVDWRAEGLDAQFACDGGITDVHAALAETGTLICCSDAGHSRGLSLVPQHHVALVRASDILPDMLDYWARLQGMPHTDLPSSQAFITGPSKTADIEGELVTGVHGPETVQIILITDA